MRRFKAAAGMARSGKSHVDDAATLLGEEHGDLTGATRAGAFRAGSSRAGALAAPVAALMLLAPGSVFADIATFFSKLAVLTFGGAYAVLAWVAQEAVGTYGWLEPGEMLDGLGMAETTPGPLIMVLQFVGFMGAFREAGWASPLLAGTSGRAACHLGHLRALLRLDFPRRPLHGTAAGKQGACRPPCLR